ncbi:MAG: hypothetical protein WA459_13345 [Stellaceae bacterium]
MRDLDLNLNRDGNRKPSVVAGPRNHLDLLSEPGSRKVAGLLAARGKSKDAGKLALQLDPQLAIIGHEPDLIDQRADELEGFGPCRRILQCLVQSVDALPINLGEVGAGQRRWRIDCGKILLQCQLARLQRHQLLLQRANRNVIVGDQLDDPSDAALDTIKLIALCIRSGAMSRSRSPSRIMSSAAVRNSRS